MSTLCDLEDALAIALIKVFALRLFRAWQDGDVVTVKAICEHIEDNYGTEALQTVGRLAADMAVQS